MSEHEAGFLSEGYADSMPALYHDTTRIHEVAAWSNEMLEARIREYTKFLYSESPKPMPRAKETAGRLLDYMMFELTQREDYDIQPTLKDLDELCEGTAA